MSRTPRNKLVFAALLGVAGLGLAVQQASLASERREVEASRARRRALLDRAAAYRRVESEQYVACARWLAEARTRQVPPSWEQMYVAPTRDVGRAPSAVPGLFGPYVCASRELPPRLWELIPSSDVGATTAGGFTQAEALLAELEAAQHPVERPTVVIDRVCSSEPAGMRLRCVVFWWRPDDGAVVASIRRSIYVGDALVSPVNVERELEAAALAATSP